MTELDDRRITSRGPGGRAALLLPGGGYGVDAPLLMFAGLAAARRRAVTTAVAWDLDGTLDDDGLSERVRQRTEAAVDAAVAGGAATPLVLAKSLGSRAASVVAERGLPAVWFTPLLDEPGVVAALRRSTAPALLVGGTVDSTWDGAVAREAADRVLEVPDAEHNLFVPGPLAASAAALGAVATAVERFLDELVWPR